MIESKYSHMTNVSSTSDPPSSASWKALMTSKIQSNLFRIAWLALREASWINFGSAIRTSKSLSRWGSTTASDRNTPVRGSTGSASLPRLSSAKTKPNLVQKSILKACELLNNNSLPAASKNCATCLYLKDRWKLKNKIS